MFEDMLDEINKETIRILFTLQLTSPAEVSNLKNSGPNIEDNELELKKEEFNPSNLPNNSPQKPTEIQPIKREEPKIGRNEPCWCKSGKKYKQCHGK